MLAIQKIKMYWEKDCRTPVASIQREPYYQPAKLEISCSGEKQGIFLNERNYIQTPENIFFWEEYQRRYGNRLVNAVSHSEGEMQERRRKHLMHMKQTEVKNKGFFYETPDDIAIPGIRLIQDSDAYRIMWHSLDVNGRYKPMRHGRNEEFYAKDSEFAGKNICNETAFVLSPGESGKIAFNYRCVGYDGQHYEQYVVYFVNTERLTEDIFTQAVYPYEYRQMADLF